jgi:hypothetical protein
MPTGGLGVVGEHPAHAIEIVENLTRALQEDFTRRGWSDELIRTLEQLDAESLLECRNLLTHGGLRQLQFLCGRGKAARVGHRAKCSQESDIEVHYDRDLIP